ncbi:MAG: protein translocase subunit SecD [Rhodospirillales bacterium]|nr:protein translocase subunit SecD [Rhodospirillales bacterium]
MLFFSRWKIWSILAVCVAGILISVPNVTPRPDWWPYAMNLGLDLRGGSYLLLEVDMPAVVRERIATIQDQVRTRMRAANIQIVGISGRENSVVFQVRDPGQAQAAVANLREIVTLVGGGGIGAGTPDLDFQTTPDGTITITLTEVALRDKATQAVAQSIEIVRRRIDETGVNEPQIARQGANRILVQLPGVDDPDRIKKLLGTTARMTFRLLDPNADPAAGQRPPPGVEFLRAENERRLDGAPMVYAVRQRVEVEGANLTKASAGTNPQTGEWIVNFEFDSLGARRFADVTRQNVGRPFAIVLDDKVISAPVIREPITGGRGQISGRFTARDAQDLAVLLRAGALPAPLTIVEERTVGPDLGADAIRAGIASIIAGMVLVFVFIVWSYGLFGVFACVGLVANLFLTVACLSLLQATLTLPGMAGLLLTLGLSVDANILINERIREETKVGKTPYAAMEAGFARAFSTIVDSNLTTLIKMMLLFAFGSGAVRGFAVTITLGILTSMFTATVLVRLMMVTWLRAKKREALPV